MRRSGAGRRAADRRARPAASLDRRTASGSRPVEPCAGVGAQGRAGHPLAAAARVITEPARADATVREAEVTRDQRAGSAPMRWCGRPKRPSGSSSQKSTRCSGAGVTLNSPTLRLSSRSSKPSKQASDGQAVAHCVSLIPTSLKCSAASASRAACAASSVSNGPTMTRCHCAEAHDARAIPALLQRAGHVVCTRRGFERRHCQFERSRRRRGGRKRRQLRIGSRRRRCGNGRRSSCGGAYGAT